MNGKILKRTRDVCNEGREMKQSGENFNCSFGRDYGMIHAVKPHWVKVRIDWLL
jgi:hypothetical protein